MNTYLPEGIMTEALDFVSAEVSDLYIFNTSIRKISCGYRVIINLNEKYADANVHVEGDSIFVSTDGKGSDLAMLVLPSEVRDGTVWYTQREDEQIVILFVKHELLF